jgi:hypothetical protein
LGRPWPTTPFPACRASLAHGPPPSHPPSCALTHSHSCSLAARSSPLASAYVRALAHPFSLCQAGPDRQPLLPRSRIASTLSPLVIVPPHPHHYLCASEVWHRFVPLPLCSCPRKEPHQVIPSSSLCAIEGNMYA